MKITSTKPRAGKPQDLLPDLDQAEETEVEVDEATDGVDLASLIETLSPEQQAAIAAQTAKFVAQMPANAQESATGWFDPSARNAMVVGGVGGFGAGALIAGLRATNNPYLVFAGTVASGIVTGYIVNKFPKKRLNLKVKSTGWPVSVELNLDAETDLPPTK